MVIGEYFCFFSLYNDFVKRFVKRILWFNCSEIASYLLMLKCVPLFKIPQSPIKCFFSDFADSKGIYDVGHVKPAGHVNFDGNDSQTGESLILH